MEDIDALMKSEPLYKNILFSDEKTKLFDCLSSMKQPIALQKFLQNTTDINTYLPSDSPLWPGNTPLHLAVMFLKNIESPEKSLLLISHFLDQGASIQVQNHLGETPLHLAFRLEQPQVVSLLLLRLLQIESEEVINLSDHENLSYLHIACASTDYIGYITLRKLFSKTQDIESSVNVAYKGKDLMDIKTGWTPLHVAVNLRCVSLVKLLLQKGATPVCKDAKGFTAIHLLFNATKTKSIADLLFASEKLRDCVVEDIGLSHLHVAVWFDDAKSVVRLLDLGANIEAKLDAPKIKYLGSTPLQIAMAMRHREIITILLHRGANMLAIKYNGKTPLSSALTGRHKGTAKDFLELIKNDEKLQKRIERKFGLTMLHIACYSLDLDQVDTLLVKGANVNAWIYHHSNFWMGYTPLHLLVKVSRAFYDSQRKKTVLKKLFENGCDVNQQDSEGKTALHLIFASKSVHCGNNMFELLSAGADINILDKNGKTVMSLALELFRHSLSHDNHDSSSRNIDDAIGYLICHIYKMKLFGIEVSQLNETLLETALEKHKLKPRCWNESATYDQLQATKKILIGKRGLNLRSFLSETGFISRFPSLTPEDRNEVSAFVQSFNDQRFSDVLPFLKLQYSKALARLSLIDPARNALKTLICSGFPDLCVDLILKYLSNSQLKYLIAAATIHN